MAALTASPYFGTIGEHIRGGYVDRLRGGPAIAYGSPDASLHPTAAEVV
jgi:hypothetical protein